MNTKITRFFQILNQNKYPFLLILFFALTDALGPIIFNIEQDCSISHILSILTFSTFYASVLISIIGLLGRRYYMIFMGLYIMYALFSYANLLYYRAFELYMPINMILEFQQLDGLGGNILGLIRWYDITYIMFFVCVCILSYYGYSAYNYRRHMFVGLLCIITTIIPVFYITNIVLKWDNFQHCKKSFEWTCNNNAITSYKGFGLIPIIAIQLQNTKTSYTLSNVDQDAIDSIILKNQQLICNNAYDVSRRHNIIIILMESLNSTCISLEFMPNLYALVQSNTTLYYPKVKQLSQAAASIGGQLIVLTGLNGLRQSVFVTDYPLNKYPSIVTEMSKANNTYPYTVISTKRHYWRQNIVSASVGMTELFEQDTNAQKSGSETNIWGWDDDKIVFDKTICNLPTDNKSFCALVVPSNMHSPYTFDSSIKYDISFPYLQDASLHEYMRRARYLDDQIASFIQTLKDKGVYDKTLIVITSDHQVPNAYCSDAMRQELSPYIPAIFINTGADWKEQNERNKEVVFCHSQVYPTMLQLMGLKPEKYAGLFPPMTNIEATQEYDFDNCDYATTTDERLKRIYDLEELIIRSSYFGTIE